MYFCTKAYISQLTRPLRVELGQRWCASPRSNRGWWIRTALHVTDPDATRLMADLINDIDVLTAADVAETVAFIASVPRHVNLTEIAILPTQQAVCPGATMSKNAKTVLITGASSGIGEATALRLADDGHRLFLGARRTQRLEALVGRIEASGGAASFRRLDVTDAADVRRFVADATDTYGGVDVMINNAGVMPLSALAENKVDEWNRMIDVNIRGVLHGISAALPVMRAQGSGHIVKWPPSAPTSGTDRGRVLRHQVRGLGYFGGAAQRTVRRDRVSVISPGVTESELAESISDEQARTPCANTAPSPFPHRRSPTPSRSPSGSPPRWTSTRSSCGRPPARTNQARTRHPKVRIRHRDHSLSTWRTPREQHPSRRARRPFSGHRTSAG